MGRNPEMPHLHEGLRPGLVPAQPWDTNHSTLGLFIPAHGEPVIFKGNWVEPSAAWSSCGPHWAHLGCQWGHGCSSQTGLRMTQMEKRATGKPVCPHSPSTPVPPENALARQRKLVVSVGLYFCCI